MLRCVTKLIVLLLAHTLTISALQAEPETEQPNAASGVEEFDRHTAARLAAVQKKLEEHPPQSCLRYMLKMAALPALVSAYFLIPRRHTPENRSWATLMEAHKEYILVVDQWRAAGMTIEEVRTLLADLKKQGNDQEAVTRLLMAESILESTHSVPRDKAVLIAAEGVRKGKTISDIVDEYELANRK